MSKDAELHKAIKNFDKKWNAVRHFVESKQYVKASGKLDEARFILCEKFDPILGDMAIRQEKGMV